MMFVTPTAGRVVRDPATGQELGADGLEVSRSSFWMRRLADGDVRLSRPAGKKSVKKKPDPKPEPTAD